MGAPPIPTGYTLSLSPPPMPEGYSPDEEEEKNPPPPREMSLLDKAGFAAKQALGLNPTTDIVEDVKTTGRKVAELVTGGEKEDLPAMQALPEVSYGDKALGAFSSNSGFLENLLKENPDMSMGADKQGRATVMRDGKNIAYVEQPGIGKTDVIEAVANVGLALIPGGATAGAINKLSQGGRIAKTVIGGLVEGTAALTQEKLDMDEGVNPLVVAGGALTPGLAEGFGALRRIVKPMLDSRRGKKMLETGRDYVSGNPELRKLDLSDETLMTIGMRENKDFALSQDGKTIRINGQDVDLPASNLTDEYIILSQEKGVKGITGGEASGNVKQLAGERELRQRADKTMQQMDSVKQDSIQSQILDPEIKAQNIARSSDETGRDIQQNIQENYKAVKTEAKADQATRKAAVKATPDMQPHKALPAWSRRIADVTKKHELDDSLTSETKKVARTVTESLQRRADEAIKSGTATREGAVKSQMDVELKYAKNVPPSKRAAAKEQMQRIRDNPDDDALLRDAREELKALGMSPSQANEAQSQILNVQRAIPAQKISMEEFSKTYKGINSALRSASTEGDIAALRELRGSYEEYMRGEFTDFIIKSKNPLAHIALMETKHANETWRIFKETFNKQFTGDKIGTQINRIRKGEMGFDEIVKTIVGGSNAGINVNALKRIVEAGADAGTKAGRKNNRELIQEAVMRNVYGNMKTGAANKKPIQQTYDALYQMMHGDKKAVGDALFTKRQRSINELTLKALDGARSLPEGSLKQISMLTNAYARFGIGDLRAVSTLDAIVGYPQRRAFRKHATNPNLTKRQQGTIRSYLEASALVTSANMAGKDDVTGEK